MPRQFGNEMGSLETKKGPKIAYSLEFRKILREHPGIIKTAIKLADQAVDEYSPNDINDLTFDKNTGRWFVKKYTTVGKDEKGNPIVELTSTRPMDYNRGTVLVPGNPLVDVQTGLSVTILGRSNREGMGALKRKDLCDYFKFTLDGKSYFVKRSFVTVNPGFVEFHNTRLAEWLVGEQDLLRVVKARLGYQDEKESWFVSDWEELEGAGFKPYNFSTDDYGNSTELGSNPSQEEIEARRKEEEYVEKLKLELINVLSEDRLENDVDANLFYNPKTGKFIFLDVTSMDLFNKKKTLGDPIKNRGKL